MAGLFSLILGLAIVGLVHPEPVAAQSPSTDQPELVTLQPGDRVRVEIWREEELSGEFLVDEDGLITLPLLGDLRVTGIALRSLRDTLREEYQVHLINPSINVVPLRKVLVLGEVRNPGPYEADPTESVLGVIAQAGGPTSAGNIQYVQVLRNGVVLHDRVQVEASLGGLAVRSGDQVIVRPRSWWARNQNFVVSVLLAIPSAVFTITRIVDR